MVSINRANLPTNYVDFLGESNSLMRLAQPTPQFLFAKLAIAQVMDVAAKLSGTPALQMVQAMGAGAIIPPNLDQLIRVTESLPGAVRYMDVFGLGAGDTFKMNRPKYGSGTYTQDSRNLGKVALSTTGQAIQGEETSIALFEFGGPSGASGIEPYEIRQFDHKYRAAKQNVVNACVERLLYDYTYWMDTVTRDLFRATANRTYMNGNTSVSGYTLGAGNMINIEGIFAAVKALADRNWKPFANGHYAMIVPTSFQGQMVEDVTYRELIRAHSFNNPVMGYIGSIQNVDIFECATAKSYASAESVPNDTTVPTGAAVDEALLFGPDAVGWGSAVGPEVRFHDDTSFGTVDKFIWYACHGFQTLDDRGIQRVLYQTT